MSDTPAPSDRQLVDFLRRSYHAVDGLWFLKAEERGGFEEALELDRAVWAVLAKIQARKARELTGRAGNAPEDLGECFALKLTADGHEFAVDVSGEGVRFAIRGCPWLELLRRSGRLCIAQQVAEAICLSEGGAWCAEFGEGYEFEMPEMACCGGESCVMRFSRRPSP